MKYCYAMLAGFLMLAFATATAAQTRDEQQLERNREIVRSLNWIKGPQAVGVDGNAKLGLPAEYVFLNQTDAKRFQEVMQNPSNGREYLFAPNDMRWMAFLNFDASGYVKDDEKIDSDAILQSIKDGTEAANVERKNRGWTAFHVVGWKYPPYYDTQTKRLEWAIDGRDDNNYHAINFNTRILGRRGVTSAILVVAPEGLDQAVKEFKGTLTGFNYTSGENYTEFRQGDKVAEYGLAALVAGGAAAAVVKTGAWKWLWKVLGGLAIAVTAGFKKLFGKKQ